MILLRRLLENIAPSSLPHEVAMSFHKSGKQQYDAYKSVLDLTKLIGNCHCCDVIKIGASLHALSTSKIRSGDFNYNGFKQAIDMLVDQIQDPEKYENELNDQIAHHFEKGSVTHGEYQSRIDGFFAHISRDSAKFDKYNQFNRLCSDVAGAVGKRDWVRVHILSKELQQMCSSEEEYKKNAFKYQTNKEGELITL